VYREGEILKVAGSATAPGDVAAKTVSVAGRLTVGGTLRSEIISVAGTLSAGSIETGLFSVAGLARVRGKLVAEMVRVGGRLEAGEVLARAVTIGGAISAGSVEVDEFNLRLAGRSEVDRISARAVTVRRKGDLLGLLRRSRRLRAKRIEGKIVRLSWVSCEEVLGERVYLGPGSRVGRVVYREEAKISERARVGKVVRAGPE